MSVKVRRRQQKRWLLKSLFICALLLMWSGYASACLSQATTELEKLYCQVRAKGQGQALPSFDDFRRNNPQTQRLLLKRPAKKAGFEVPLAPTQKMSRVNSASSSKKTAKKSPTKTVKPRPLSAELRSCEVRSRTIYCGQQAYLLRDNLPNTRLQAGVLSANNQLLLPQVPAYKSSRELHDYLQSAYRIYLEKMDGLGLAGATFTYSKFYYIYDDAKQQKQDFVQRFKSMFEFLKKDKATMAAGLQHKGKPLPPLASCDFYSPELIACDQQGRNWLFKAKIQ